jgi:hypothetical protein
MSLAVEATASNKSGSTAYTRRVPEDTVLYAVVSNQLPSFLSHAEQSGRSVPAFVERELSRYLECGILAYGFVRVRCAACRFDRVVAFSCKGRGFCPSCGGRRMADTAAFLVDRVLPHMPVRQWVLSLPIALRYKLAYDSALAAEVLQLFVRSVFASLRRRARYKYGLARYDCGSVTFVQRFGDALNLNLHFHSIVLDGVYHYAQGGAVRYRRLPPPTNAEVEQTTRRIVRRLRRLLIARGLTPDADAAAADPLPEDQPLLAEIYAASVRSRIAIGERAGLGVLRIGDLVDPEEAAFVTGPRSTMIDGVSLHANVSVLAGDRRRLEKLCRYIARPPVSTERLSKLGDGRLLYRLKRRWRDGTTHVVFQPPELVEKLAAIVPPPRIHMVRYHGVLAPRAGCRREVVGARNVKRKSRDEIDDSASDCSHTSRRWMPWAKLMQRVFAIDVLECPRCRGKMKILATIHPPKATAAILESLGLVPRAPPLAAPSLGAGGENLFGF